MARHPAQAHEDFPEVRGPILSAACREDLDRFRSFRHRVRNSYGMALDGDIVVERAQELAPALVRFHDEVTPFLKGWDAREV